ncbi:MAG: hypothetical protein CSA20_02670 [Deltaproteobacteria bacterium]|nr:MAG: hypothetical protein CSA20_02670 [Deltaproteobacteria bacterium]
MKTGSFSLRTQQHMELVDITPQIENFLSESNAQDGFCFIYVPHTTAAVTINEGADPAVARDIIYGLKRIVPEDGHHHLEGNSPSHIMASLLGTSQTVAVVQGRIVLGTWQRIFFCEFDGPRTRTVQCSFSKTLEQKR